MYINKSYLYIIIFYVKCLRYYFSLIILSSLSIMTLTKIHERNVYMDLNLLLNPVITQLKRQFVHQA